MSGSDLSPANFVDTCIATLTASKVLQELPGQNITDPYNDLSER